MILSLPIWLTEGVMLCSHHTIFIGLYCILSRSSGMPHPIMISLESPPDHFPRIQIENSALKFLHSTLNRFSSGKDNTVAFTIQASSGKVSDRHHSTYQNGYTEGLARIVPHHTAATAQKINELQF